VREVAVILHQLGRVGHPRNPNMHVPTPEFRCSERAAHGIISRGQMVGAKRVAFRCALLTEERSEMRRRGFHAHLLLQSSQPGADFLSDFIDRTHATDNYKLTFGSIIR
jgi:hypothetical protein